MIRLLIVIICYTLVVISLPRFAPFAELMGELARLPNRTALIINISALISGGFLLHALTRQPGGLLYKYPSPLLIILRTGLIGVVLSALFDVFQALSGYAITVQGLILLPLAFITGEAAYQLALWGWHKARKTPQQMRAPLEDLEDTQRTGGVPRLLVTLPVYAFIIVYLPQQQDFRHLEAKLVNVGPTIGLAISIAALISAAGLVMMYLSNREKAPLSLTGDAHTDAKTAHLEVVKQTIVLTFAIGLGIAALINIVGYFVNYSPSLVLLIIMPLGFTLAEALYEGLNWRLKYGPPEG